MRTFCVPCAVNEAMPLPNTSLSAVPLRTSLSRVNAAPAARPTAAPLPALLPICRVRRLYAGTLPGANVPQLAARSIALPLPTLRLPLPKSVASAPPPLATQAPPVFPPRLGRPAAPAVTAQHEPVEPGPELTQLEFQRAGVPAAVRA